MEVATDNEAPTRIRAGETHEIGRAHGVDSSDKTISRRHLSLSVAGAMDGEEIRLQFEVLGRNPIYVHRDSEVKIYRRFERGEMGNGDMLCFSGKNPIWYSVRRIEDGPDGVGRNVTESSELSGEITEMDSDFGFEGGLDISDLDPVKEFGFVVEGHEFETYPKKMIRDMKDWDWFVEEQGGNGEDDQVKRKKGAKNDDDEWTGESEDERELTGKSKKARRAKYTTRSKDHGKQSEMSPMRRKNGDDDNEDEDDETLGGFVVDDENLDEEEEEDEDEDE